MILDIQHHIDPHVFVSLNSIIDIIRNIVTNINVRYILSIIQRNDKNAYHIAIMYIFQFNHFQDKCPFLLWTDENCIVFNGIIIVYSIIINTKYAINKYGIISGNVSIFIIFNIGWHNIKNNAICDNNLLENVLDHIKYSINCIIMKDW